MAACCLVGVLLPGVAVHAQPLRTIYSFPSSALGSSPSAGLIYANGALFGTTAGGGTDDCGTVFKVDPVSSAHAIIHSFTCTDGANPQARLLYLGGALYGTASQGGAAGVGTVFRIGLPGGSFTLLHSFANGDDGEIPSSGLLYHDGMLYGSTAGGGAGGGGTLFSIALSNNAFGVPYSFDSFAGCSTPSGQLLFVNGVLYGTLMNGGPNANYSGAVYNFDPATGKVAILHYFSAAPVGLNTPTDGVIYQAGVLYGTTAGGRGGGVFSLAIPSRAYHVLHVFAGGSDGSWPRGGLSYAGGKLYGATYFGGVDGLGSIFSVDTATGKETVLHGFTKSTGTNPWGGLLYQGGLLYGTTVDGRPGSGDEGTIFSIPP